MSEVVWPKTNDVTDARVFGPDINLKWFKAFERTDEAKAEIVVSGKDVESGKFLERAFAAPEGETGHVLQMPIHRAGQPGRFYLQFGRVYCLVQAYPPASQTGDLILRWEEPTTAFAPRWDDAFTTNVLPTPESSRAPSVYEIRGKEYLYTKFAQGEVGENLRISNCHFKDSLHLLGRDAPHVTLEDTLHEKPVTLENSIWGSLDDIPDLRVTLSYVRMLSTVGNLDIHSSGSVHAHFLDFSGKCARMQTYWGSISLVKCIFDSGHWNSVSFEAITTGYAPPDIGHSRSITARACQFYGAASFISDIGDIDIDVDPNSAGITIRTRGRVTLRVKSPPQISCKITVKSIPENVWVIGNRELLADLHIINHPPPPAWS